MIHHSAIRVHDVDASLRFWRDGLGFDVLMDETFTGDWSTLLRARTDVLRSIFLGQADRPDCGIVELVDLGSSDAASPPEEDVAGFLLLSVMTDVDAVLSRLADLGLGGAPRRITVHGVAMAVVVDPDGVAVELIDSGAAITLERDLLEP